MAAAISTNSYHPRSFITTRFDPNRGMLTYVHNDVLSHASEHSQRLGLASRVRHHHDRDQRILA